MSQNNQNIHDTRARSQRNRLAKLLIKLGCFNTIEAREHQAIMAPAPRIKELREMGWNITTQRIKAKDSRGVEHKNVALYVLTTLPIQGTEHA